MPSRPCWEKSLTAAERRDVVNQLMRAGLSQRRSCALAQISRSCWVYAKRANDDDQLIALLRDFAQTEKRAGPRSVACLSGAARPGFAHQS
jgi:hypothetical protein